VVQAHIDKSFGFEASEEKILTNHKQELHMEVTFLMDYQSCKVTVQRAQWIQNRRLKM
jgi:hypothetical protein